MKNTETSIKMQKKIKASLEKNNYNADNAYMEMMSDLNLFGKAFFGHSCTKYEKRKMQTIWNAVLFNVLEFSPNLRDWQRSQIKSFLDIRQ